MFSRITAARRLPQIITVPKRFTSSINEGSVASSKDFGRKEKAHEDQYTRARETELLKKMRAEIDKKKSELERLEKEHEAEIAKAGKN
ncbi:hypothetical protein FB45DRAFT_1033312 [Roridomyces roridus]|uniref:ATPase inhibitor, mitochondrial n=1 Tax=Roridomyces roridus TaxID=1738132 RepID=A0AAD7BF40_9AGAR|nr:hypothetical protein FB45DRAFT_1033312 [Roridomyces roridus]